MKAVGNVLDVEIGARLKRIRLREQHDVRAFGLLRRLEKNTVEALDMDMIKVFGHRLSDQVVGLFTRHYG